MNVRITGNFFKKPGGILIRIEVDLYSYVGGIVILTIFSLLTPERGISFHVFTSPIFFNSVS